MSVNRLVPLKKIILFQFLDETGGSKGAFSERTRGKIILTKMMAAQTEANRWGKVVAVGPEVHGIKPGDYLLIAAQKWSMAEQFDHEKIWRTADIDDAVMAVTDDVNLTYSF